MMPLVARRPRALSLKFFTAYTATKKSGKQVDIAALIGMSMGMKPGSIFLQSFLYAVESLLVNDRFPVGGYFLDLNRRSKQRVRSLKHTLSAPLSCTCADYSEIEENVFNLNIPRFVDTFEPEPEIDMSAV